MHKQTGAAIKSLALNFISYMSGNIIVPPSKDGKTITVHYFPNIEGSFIIEVTFDSGKILHFNAGYIENGYAFE